MTNQEAITIIGNLEDKDMLFNPCDVQDAKTMAINALEQEPCEDAVSLETVIEWLKTKDIIKLFSQEETARRELKALQSVKQEPFINKPCISEGVCHEDKVKVLEKIRAEIEKASLGKWYVGRTDGKSEDVLLLDKALAIIDKYTKGDADA